MSDYDLDPIEVPEVWAWVRQRWPASTRMHQVAKVAEESGEAVGEAIRLDLAAMNVTTGEARAEIGLPTAHVGRCLDELADTIIAAIGAIQSLRRDPAAVVADRWYEVSRR